MSVTPIRENGSMTAVPLPLLPAGPPVHPALAEMHPAVAEWFRRRFPEGPTAPQEEAWPHDRRRATTPWSPRPPVRARRSPRSSCASTASTAPTSAGEEIDGVARVVYVSPLKALAVDIAENLERPLAEIAEVAAELGLDAPDVRVGGAHRRHHRARSAPRWCASRRASWSPPPSRSTCSSPARRAATRCARSRPSSSTRSTRSRATSAARTSRSRSSGSRRCASSARTGSGSRPRSARSRRSAGCSSATGRCRSIVDAGHQRDLDLALELPEGELPCYLVIRGLRSCNENLCPAFLYNNRLLPGTGEFTNRIKTKIKEQGNQMR